MSPIQTNGLEEYLIFMTKKGYIILNLSDYHRTDDKRNSLVWTKATIEVIDLIKNDTIVPLKSGRY